jgi:uncharacterized protein
MKLDLERTETGASELPVAGDLALDFGPAGPNGVFVTGVLRVDNLESRFVLRGELEVCGEAVCDRCLGTFPLRFAAPVEMVILCDAGSQEDDEGDTPVIHQRQGEVDLTDALREAVALAVPLQRICRDHCRGLCPGCGIDLNQETCGCQQDDSDPRWAGLPD